MAGYSVLTIKRLFALSMNKCAHQFGPYPACEVNLVDPKGHSVMAEICHIQAQSQRGPRYNDEMTEEDRWAFENLILMCPNHHNMIDNVYPELYTIEVLTVMKNAAIESGSRSTWGHDNDALIDRAVQRTIVVMNRLNALIPLEPVSLREPVAIVLDPGGVKATASVSFGGVSVDAQVTRAAPDELLIDENVATPTPVLHLSQDDSETDDRGTR
jgi:hypothetical protein